MEENSTSQLSDFIIWGGATISLVGLAGLIWCIVKVARARRTGMAEDQMRDFLKGVLPLNLGALFLSVIGLMVVIVGIFLS